MIRSGLTPALVALGLAACGVTSLAAAESRQVVFVYDERVELPGLAALDEALERALLAGSPWPVEIYRVNLDLSRFGAPGYDEVLRDFLRAKFESKRIEVAVAVMGPSLDFLLGHGDEVFPDASIVFCGIDRRDLERRPPMLRTTGVLLGREFAPTLELALEIHPDTRNVVFVGGTSSFDSRLVEQAREELRPFASRVDLSFRTDLPLGPLLTELGRLPPKSLVLYSALFRDGAGGAFVPHEVAERVSAAANAPVYGFSDQYLGRGIVGGRLYGFGDDAARTAGLIRRVLAGESPESIPPVESRGTTTQFDWRQMERWGIGAGALPPDATIRYRPESIWKVNRSEAIGGVSLLTLQAGLIGALLAHRARRRRAESALRETEERFRTLADTTPVMLWTADVEGRLSFVNWSWLEFTGGTRSGESEEVWYERIHPDDRGEYFARMEHGAADRTVFSAECRLKRRDGEYSWFQVTKVPRFAVDGTFVGFMGSCVDLTTQKDAAREAQRSQQQLAHASRVTTLGELSASVAHELKQPLGAILANAEAAEMLLDADRPDLNELREILVDIRADDERASEILTRMRKLLEKHEMVRRPLELDRAVDDIFRLMRIEAAERHVGMELVTRDAPLPVEGDRVHLQQVVMNLILNGLEAMSGLPESERRLVVITGRGFDGTAEIVVEDSGPGFSEDQAAHLFEPFWSTKRHGLGMGLSISRSIVEAHEGRIFAERGEHRGARFRVALPLSRAERS